MRQVCLENTRYEALYLMLNIIYQAQMRASVFDILNGKERKEIYMENKKVQNIAKTNFGIVTQIALILQGALLTELVREYLQFYDLDYSLSVLVPEANLVTQQTM